MNNKLLSLLFFFLFTGSLLSQDFKVIVEGLKAGDSAQVIMQKSSERLLKKYAKANSDDESIELTFSLENGKWALKVDAAGYTFPSSKVITVPNDTSAKVTFTRMLEENYKYTWNDDESSSGHATQTYVGEPTTIVVKDKTVKVPSDYSSVKLRKEFGIVLSDDIEPWSVEDSYRLYSTMLMLPYNPDYNVNFETGDGVRGVFYLTNDEQYKDLTISSENGLKNATISQPAFTYASPLVVTVDGIKGKFYSKRLYHVLVNYLTEFGTDEGAVDHIAMESFGFKFMKSNDETQELMGEDKSNFQEFFAEEKVEILAMFEELPEGFHKQEELKYMVRRINGQSHPKYPSAPAIAWVGMETIEWMEKSFKGTDLGYVHRLILHEKAHFLWEHSFDQKTKDDWAEIGGWYQDPTSGSGWSTTNTTEFVSAYAHAKNPNEDMAESIAAYVTNPDILLSRSVKKYEFIRDRIMHGTRYVAQIREDLTFTVYNLYPDYTYPGKIIGVEVEVIGAPEDDKTVKLKLKLESNDLQYDGASHAQLRFVSNVGTYRDMWLYAQNGDIDSVLVGETSFSKHDKNGYWVLGGNIDVRDKVGNSRFENHSTIGLKLFINSPLEDFKPSLWNDEFEISLVEDYFTNSDGGGPISKDDQNSKLMNAIKFDFSFYDDSPMQRALVLMTIPDPKDGSEAELYGQWTQENPKESTNGYGSIKEFTLYQKIPDYYPSGYYLPTEVVTEDIARNQSRVYLMDNPDTYNENPEKGLFSHQRDSIYVETKYPDYLKPEIDVNNIIITAEPVNPTNPDGETDVDITFVYRDLSDYEGFESGVKDISIILRDPLGKDHGFRTQNNSLSSSTRGANAWTNIWYDLTPSNTNEWFSETFTVRLPKGSAPGKWGLLSTNIQDKANNTKKYSFVEYVRFDIIESDVVLTNPLEVEILDKYINAKNVDSISAKMSCSPCKDLNYVYTIYSRMGGGGAVVRGEGVFESDTIVVKNIKTSGVLDGLLNLTVQVTDSTDALVATKTAEYLKDVVYPKSYYSRSNIQDQGWSNIDDIVIDIEVESQDVNGTYNVNVSNNDNNKSGIPQGASSSVSSFDFNGDISESKFNFSASNISSLTDGYLKFTTTITDQVGNIGDPVVSYYLKDGNRIQYLGNQIDPNSDEDQDGIPFSEDNSPTFWNPGQEDVDNDGIGDWSDNNTIMTSISEKFMSDTINLSSLISKSLFKIHGEEREIKTLDFRNINDNEIDITIDTAKLKAYKSENHSIDFLDQYIYDYRIGVTNSNSNNIESLDSLDLRIYVDKYKGSKNVESQKVKVNGNLTQFKYFSPYSIDHNNTDYYDRHGDIPTQWRSPDFESAAYFEDINNDGNMDLIFGDYRVDFYGRNFNIHHLSDYVYLLGDGNFNFTSTYNSEINGLENNVINHSPNITIRADLNNDGKKEIVNYGEEYHITYPPHHPHINYIHEWMYSKDLVFEKDFNDAGKKTRYYSFHESGQLIDEVNKISTPNLSSDNPNYLRNMFASAVGDIDNDGDLDLISSGQNSNMGYSYDILKNDGTGNFTLDSQTFNENYNTSEGHMLVFDIDNDGNNDLLFGGQKKGFESDYSVLGLVKGDGNSLDFNNPIFLEELAPELGLRSVFYQDINGDNIKEVIAYYTVGFGCNGCGLSDDDIPNIIKIYELVDSSEGYLKEISDQYFSDNQNFMNFYAQTSFLQYIDLDGDGYKDIIPKFSLEDLEDNDYPGNAYRGDWNDSKGFQYFKYDKESEKFILINLGQFNNIKHYNLFDFADLNNDGNLEWITFIESARDDNGFYIFEYFFDLDNDGVFDYQDNCHNTPSGAVVDVNGCEIFNLPVNNFKVEVGSATCIGNSDGVINLSVEDASYDYTVTITGNDNVTITGDAKTASVAGLDKGTYTVCFSVDGQADYEQCFEVNVTEPPALSAFIDIDTDDRRASIVMSGSSSYNIEINGKKTTVGSDSFETSLSTGLNIIKVYTDLECQGYVEEEVFISEDIHYYPNPTENDVKVHVGGKDTKVKVSVFNTSGALVYTKEQMIEDISRKTAIDLSRQIKGTYIIIMESETVRQTFKIIRE